MSPIKSSWLSCGIPLDKAACFVAISEVCLGGYISGFVLYQAKLSYKYENESKFCKRLSSLYPKCENLYNMFGYYSVVIVYLFCSVFQTVFGILLLWTSAAKDGFICRIWIIVSLGIMFTGGFIFRVYQTLIVVQLEMTCRKSEPNNDQSGGTTSSSTTVSFSSSDDAVLDGNNRGRYFGIQRPSWRNVGNPFNGDSRSSNPLLRISLEDYDEESASDNSEPPPPYHVAISHSTPHLI